MGSKTSAYEIELRARFDENTYKRLRGYLFSQAQDLGEDNKDNYIFIFPDKSLKVVHAISKQKAKIALKLTRIGESNDFEEIEIGFDRNKFDDMAKVFKSLGFTEVQHSYQQRHNFLYKGVELALKYSDAWGHHLELEIVIDDLINQSEAENKIRKVAKELDVKLMTNEEITKFCAEVDKKENQKSK